jgi:branched-chain amino acid aminotransferase
VWVDGRTIAAEEAVISVLAHAVQRGAAVFDVGALRPGAKGARLLFRPLDHVLRLLRSASLVGLEVPWDADALLGATLETARTSGVSSALVRWSVFVPTMEPDVVPRPGTHARVVIAILPSSDGPTSPSPPRSPLRVTIPRDARKPGPEVFPPQAKVGASYLGPMLAKRRAQEQGYDEVVLLDAEGHVAEAPTANVFAVRRGEIFTPALGRVLPGITRDSILALATAEGLVAREAHLSPEQLLGADEAFLAATSYPVLGIASIEGHPLKDGAPGLVTARLLELLVACERGEDGRFAQWIVPV